MRRFIKSNMAAVFVGLLGLCTSLALAQEKPGDQGLRGGGMTRGRMMGDMGGGDEGRAAMMMQGFINNPGLMEELTLTDEQKTKLKQLQTEFRRNMIDLEAVLQHKALDLADRISQDTPDEAALMKAIEETSAARLDIAKKRIKNLLQVRAVLTPEQRQKMREMMRQHMKEQVEQRRKGGPEKAKGVQKKRGPQGSEAPPLAPPPGGPGPGPEPDEQGGE